MNDRAEPVLATALERLVENGTLTPEQATAVRTDFHRDLDPELRGRPGRPQEGRDSSWSLILTEVGGYVGTAFVVGAAAALVGPEWGDLSRNARVAVLAGPALFLLIAAVVVARSMAGGWVLRPDGPGGPRRRLVSTLILAAGGLLAGATAIITPDSDPQRLVPLVALLVWGVGYVLCRGVLLHLGTGAALAWMAMSIVDSGSDQAWQLNGLLLVIAGAGWVLLVARGLVEERAVGIAVAGVMAFTGGEIVVADGAEGYGYLLLGLLALAGLAGYIRTRELSALGVGAVALAVVVPQAVIDYTEGSLGAAGGLLVSGLSIVAVSVLATRLRRIRSAPTQLV
jgi:hypothetical protein